MKGITIFVTAAWKGVSCAGAVACKTWRALVIKSDITSESPSELSTAFPDISTIRSDVRAGQVVVAMAAIAETVVPEPVDRENIA